MIYSISPWGGSIDLSTIIAIGPIYSVQDSQYTKKFWFTINTKHGPIDVQKTGNWSTDKDNPRKNWESTEAEVTESHSNLTNTWITWKKEQSSIKGTGTDSGESGEILRT